LVKIEENEKRIINYFQRRFSKPEEIKKYKKNSNATKRIIENI
jgi:hypothetical protein